MKLGEFKHNDWHKIWDGGWCFLSCTHFAREYTREIIFGNTPFQSQSIIFSSRGRSSGWMRQSDRDRLGKKLAKEVTNKKSAQAIANRLKFQAKDFLKFITKHQNTNASEKLYKEFWERLCIYYKAHINVKYVVDYLVPDLLKKYLLIFQETRVAAEPVLNRTEKFLVSFVKILQKETGYRHNLLLCLTHEEINKYFKTKTLPSKKLLSQRHAKSAILHNGNALLVVTGTKVKAVEKLIKAEKTDTETKGSTAFGGKIRGIVRIVPDPKKATIFNAGDILVTGATRPEFLPIMSKAGAFVTDAGGILSHAAITAREMKKPCIIGTKYATKVFKDGDLVELDADKGIVKLIKKHAS